MDAQTFIHQLPGVGNRPTFTMFVKGIQTAGVPVSCVFAEDTDILQVLSSTVGVFLQLTNRAAGLIPTSQFVTGVVGCSQSSGFTQLNHRMKAGEKVWLDTLGGMGTSDWALIVCALAPAT